MDPGWTLGEGALVVCCRATHRDAVLAALADAEVAAHEIGEVVRGAGAVWITEADGRVVKLTEPLADPYWDAYARAVREGWS